MLFKMMEYMKPINNLKYPQKGLVVDNEDPSKLNRVKCVIKGIIEGPTSKLPWVFPRNPTGLGGSPDSSSFAIPEVGSEVTVVFPYNDVYHPEYVGYWQSQATHQTIFDEDYPETYGYTDSTGTYIKINKKQKYLEVHHTSGTKINVDSDGNVTIENPGHSQIDTGDYVNINVGSYATITAEGESTINGSKVNLNKDKGPTGDILTTLHINPITGLPYPEGSTTCKAHK